MKIKVLASIGTIGGFLAALLGGWDMGLKTLIIMMIVDYLTGLIVAGIFKKSTKSESGALESKAGWKGLCRKGVTLLIVLVAARLDEVANTTFIRDAVVIGYIANEAISIIENASLMGIPIPEILKRSIDVLKKKSEKEGETE